MRVAKELREKYGVTIIAVTQPIDTSNPGGVFQQNMQFLFSEYDNQLRRQRAIAGTKEKLERGIWCLKPPMGYSVIKEDRERRIVINETGKKLRKAFEWKAKGIKNDEILSRLKAMGAKIYKQKLSMTFSNPFYCGIIANKTLNGKLIEGKHEKLISKELFLSIHQKRTEAKGKYGVSHTKENHKFPLKLFMKCEKCNTGYTGYSMKKKNKTSSKVHQFYYYKCRTVGCKCNKNTTMVDRDFITFLNEYTIQPHLIAPLLYHMKYAFEEHHSAAIILQKTYESNLSAIEKKIEELEEDFYLIRKVPENTYTRLITKLLEEKQEILKNLPPTGLEISNLQKYFEAGITISTKLATVWDSSPVSTKEKIQKLIFPEGVTYNHQMGIFRTSKVNLVFAVIPQLNSISGSDKQKQDGVKTILSI